MAEAVLIPPPMRPVAPSPAVAAAAGPARLAVAQLTAWYGATSGVRDVTLGFQANTVTALIGPSGCGKSTFLRALNRMHELVPGARVTGHVLLDGHDLYAPGVNPIQVRRRIGMVFQKPTPFPTMSIAENVAAGLRVGPRLNRAEREVLLLDEPTASLDPVGTGRIEDLIHELKREFTVIIVTHNLQQAARVSDTTAFFYLGELVEAGPTAQLFTAPARAQTEAYVTGRFG